MEHRQQSRFTIMVGLACCLPLSSGIAAWFILEQFTNYQSGRRLILTAAVSVLVAMLTFWWLYRQVNRPLKSVYQQVDALNQRHYDYRAPDQLQGVFGGLNLMLDQLSNQLQQFSAHDQAELAIIKAEAGRLRNVVNAISDGVIALDSAAHIILFNKAAIKITGYGLAEAAGKPVSQILPLLRGNSLVLNDWLSACEGADLQSKQWEAIRLKTKDGKVRSVDVEALYQGTDPNGIRTLVTFHDRTEMQEVEDMKVDFVALAAHELRTPITVIRGYLEILENELGASLNNEHKEIMRKLTISASQLSGFINNILHVSRIEHGDLNLKLEPTDWIELMQSTCQELINKASILGKKLVLNLPDKLPPVAVDRTSIVEVINNLVDNAIKYSETGTEVIVSVKPSSDMIETIIQDSGVGIPENAIDKLFTKFYRSHRTRASHRGTGLGLYMSKAIVEAHGGNIWVHSVVGQGSTFGFLLPTYDKLSHRHLEVDGASKITRGVHGWIKNHSLYRG